MTTWHLPTETPNCPKGDMISVIVQRNGCVFGGWYCHEYPLIDETDTWNGIRNDDGTPLRTGFCDKVPHGHFDDYYEFAQMHDLQCWAYMPAANEAALMKGGA